MAASIANIGGAVTAAITRNVIAGLDPAIHHLGKGLTSLMDTRVKPAYDSLRKPEDV
jgi:hypothetical protein